MHSLCRRDRFFIQNNYYGFMMPIEGSILMSFVALGRHLCEYLPVYNVGQGLIWHFVTLTMIQINLERTVSSRVFRRARDFAVKLNFNLIQGVLF